MLMKPMRSNGFIWMAFSDRVSDSGGLMCCGRGRIEVDEGFFFFFLIRFCGLYI